MAAGNKLFQRYLWLVDTIYSAGEITREEIDRRWARSAYNDDKESCYTRRNFFRHRDAIYEMFGIDIACDKSRGNVYYIKNLGDLKDGGMRAWLIDTFAVSNMVNLAGGLQDRIEFEQIPEGSRYLSQIVSAMKESRKLMVTYQRFDRPEPHTFLLSPYSLKVSKQRWYMVGKPDDHPEETEPRVYALDRVKDMAITDKLYVMPRGFDVREFFRYQFGVDRSNRQAETIRIRVKSLTANYLRTLPIHSSQYEEERNEQYSIFRYELAPTYDFVQELRKHGPTLEVLAPESLRERMRKDAEECREMYGH